MADSAVTDTPPRTASEPTPETPAADGNRGSPDRRAAPAEPGPDDVARAASRIDPLALQILQEAYAARAARAALPSAADLARRAAQEFDATVATVDALHALADAGLDRAAQEDDTARLLQDAGADAVSAHLRDVAEHLRQQLGIDARPSGRPGEGLPGSREVRAARRTATHLYDAVRADDLRAVLDNPVERYPAVETGADLPEGFTREDTSSRDRFARAVENRLAGIDAGPPIDSGVRDALVGLLHALRIPDPERHSPDAEAMQIVFYAPHPRRTAEFLAQIAIGLQDWFHRDRDEQLQALQPFPGDRTLAEHLRAIALDTAGILDDPAHRAYLRAAQAFGSTPTSLWQRDQARPFNPAAPTVTTTVVPRSPEPLPGPSPEPAHSPPPAEPAPEPAHSPPPPAEPAADPTARSPAPAAPAPLAPPPRPYRYDATRPPEHALLGSLLHAPSALGESGLPAFLRARDFPTTDTRAAYEILVGLHKDGLLFDIRSPGLTSDKARMHVAGQNRRTLHAALLAAPSKYTRLTVSNPLRLLRQLDAAAPPGTATTRSVYDPVTQLHLGRMVVGDATYRALRAAGAMLERTKPLIPLQRTPTRPADRRTEALVQNLATMDANLRGITERLVEAVRLTGPDDADDHAAATAIAQREKSRWTLPDSVRSITRPRLDRAERHLLHILLHAGTMTYVPEEILHLPPDVFASPLHANTWRTIQDLRARGQSADYIAVIREAQGLAFPYHPMLSAAAIDSMRHTPELSPAKVAASLRIVNDAALSRTTAQTRRAIAAVTADRDIPALQAVGEVRGRLAALADRAQQTLPPHPAPAPPQPTGRRTSR
ncbi:hypothetical protein [Amycolatopsis sp. WGS_07]|uniref:hypothetical protein n=1 Tax=Amycolatopsis sp. WGS_07 TaxID=3076764 RepID=UPI003872F2FD